MHNVTVGHDSVQVSIDVHVDLCTEGRDGADGRAVDALLEDGEVLGDIEGRKGVAEGLVKLVQVLEL